MTRERAMDSVKTDAKWKLVPVEPTPEMIEAGDVANPTAWNEDTDLGFGCDVAFEVYRAMLAASPPADEWRPIETAPHETNVLLAWQDWSLPGRWRMEAGMASWGWRNEVASTMSRHGEATHWMPLPTPPAGADEGGKNGG